MQMKIGEGRKMDYLLLILGFILLIKGADYFVDGSSSVAKLLKVPTIIIGLTVVAFGTSMPELSVSVTAAIKGNNDLAVSNVLGSNILDVYKRQILYIRQRRGVSRYRVGGGILHIRGRGGFGGGEFFAFLAVVQQSLLFPIIQRADHILFRAFQLICNLRNGQHPGRLIHVAQQKKIHLYIFSICFDHMMVNKFVLKHSGIALRIVGKC